MLVQGLMAFPVATQRAVFNTINGGAPGGSLVDREPKATQ